MDVLREGYTCRATGFLVIKSVFLISIVLENGYCSENKNQRCPTEKSLANNSIPVYWNSNGINNEIVLSSPPCTDDLGNLVTRVCSNQIWIPPDASNICSKVTRYGRRCPLQFEETSDSCIFFASPKPWGNICSLEALIEDFDNTQLKNELLWLPYKRLSKYGPFESLTFGDKFGTPFDKPIKGALTDKDFFEKNCLLTNISSEEYYPEYCNENHSYFCQFSKTEVNSKCPKGCKSVDFFSDKCYCKQKEDCSKLASIKTMYDYTILSDLSDDDECIIANDVYPNSSFQEFSQSFSHKIWYYTTKNLSKSLCIVPNMKASSPVEPEMVLNFDNKEEKLYLTIYSPENLYNQADEETIYCFTNAAVYKIKKRMEVDKIIENTETARWYYVYQVELEENIGNYYCEAYKSINSVDDKITSNTVLAYKSNKGSEFAVHLIIKGVCYLFECNQTSSINLKKIVKTTMTSFKEQVRVMEIYNFDFISIDLLIHVSIDDYDILEGIRYITRYLESMNNTDIIYVRSSQQCLPEVSEDLSWPLTEISQSAVSDQKCLQSNGLPVVRTCGGDFLTGAQWQDVVGECAEDVDLPDSTKYIYFALQQNLTRESVKNVTSIIKSDPNLPVLSIYYASKFLNKIFTYVYSNTSNFLVNSTINIIDSLLNVKKEFLVYAQDLLNTTDDLIDSVEDVLIKMTLNVDTLLVKRPNLIIHVTKPILSNISGLIVYKETGKEPTVVDLERNSSLSDVGPNALLALKIPEKILTYNNNTNLTIITTIYFKDVFFESNYTKKPAGPVISITIPDFGTYLPASIPILFQVSNYTDTPECGFWDYGKKTVREKGHWSTIGGTYEGEFDNISHYHICTYSHLTHLSMLKATMRSSITETDDTILNVIAIVGDVLTIIGISGIFITAFLFKRWRKKQGTIILLNLSISLLLETFIMQLSDTQLFVMINKCTFFGILLHYFVLCKFCWMLVYSFLQYMRFVKVLTILPENIVLKSTIFGWGFAVIPVGVVNIIDPTSYTYRKYNYCYPVGLHLYLGVLMPAGIIIFINTFVFIAVMREITSNSIESHGSKENVQKLQIQLACLLFFVLGVPWLFWIFANFISVQWLRLTLIYLFSITSNIQGFILFLFYVLLNKETKLAWANYFYKNRPKSFSVSTKTSSKS